MALRQIFLDWGGTVAAARPEFRRPARVWARFAQELGWTEVTEEKVSRAMERIDDAWQKRMYDYLGRTAEFWPLYDGAVLDELGIRERRQELARRVDAFMGTSERYELFSESAEVVQELRSRGFPVGVISNSSDQLLRSIRHHGLEPWLHPVVVTQQVGAEKPDRRVFEHALARAACRPEEALHVGDSFRADYLGATGAGLRALWLNREGVAAPGPCEQVPDLRALLPLVGTAR